MTTPTAAPTQELASASPSDVGAVEQQPQQHVDRHAVRRRRPREQRRKFRPTAQARRSRRRACRACRPRSASRTSARRAARRSIRRARRAASGCQSQVCARRPRPRDQRALAAAGISSVRALHGAASSATGGRRRRRSLRARATRSGHAARSLTRVARRRTPVGQPGGLGSSRSYDRTVLATARRGARPSARPRSPGSRLRRAVEHGLSPSTRPRSSCRPR